MVLLMSLAFVTMMMMIDDDDNDNDDTTINDNDHLQQALCHVISSSCGNGEGRVGRTVPKAMEFMIPSSNTQQTQLDSDFFSNIYTQFIYIATYISNPITPLLLPLTLSPRISNSCVHHSTLEQQALRFPIKEKMVG